jgi:hypothetical protein
MHKKIGVFLFLAGCMVLILSTLDTLADVASYFINKLISYVDNNPGFK